MHRAAFALCLMAAGAWADTSAPSEKAKTFVLATLERTACYGRCPIYKLTIFSDGRVEWVGEQFVKQKGKALSTLTPAQLSALRAAFSDANYLELKGPFDCYEITDHPSANTSYSDGTRKKSINHYHGCRSAAGATTLTALENKIDQIVNSERWVGMPR